jgi:hypothetical protein
MKERYKVISLDVNLCDKLIRSELGLSIGASAANL